MDIPNEHYCETHGLRYRCPDCAADKHTGGRIASDRAALKADVERLSDFNKGLGAAHSAISAQLDKCPECDGGGDSFDPAASCSRCKGTGHTSEMTKLRARCERLEGALRWFLEPDRPIGSNAEQIHRFTTIAKAALATTDRHGQVREDSQGSGAPGRLTDDAQGEARGGERRCRVCDGVPCSCGIRDYAQPSDKEDE